jgi:hypothetical protein
MLQPTPLLDLLWHYTRRFVQIERSTPARDPRRVGVHAGVTILLVCAVIFPAAAAASASPPSKAAASKTKQTNYMGKDYIDSTMLRAIFIINDGASTAGVGFRTKQSLDEAWRLARKIKTESKGDPNERYALWKVNELEWLIRLEERDLMFQKMKEGEATVNQIIADYNTEVGKASPDFKKLTRMHARMLEFDIHQANAMATSINNRVRAMSLEAVLRLEKALLSRNTALADQEYKYLLRNRPYLKLSNKTFEELETRSSACIRARDELPTVTAETEKARELVRQVRLAEARSMLALAQYRFSDIRSFIPELNASRLHVAISEVEQSLGKKEDSLVTVNFDLLRKKGVAAANEYLQHVVREKGVCRDKIARVDQAILSVGSPSENSAIAREIDALEGAADQAPENDVVGEMRAKAMKKAQRKLDSLRVIEEARARREQKQQDSIDAVAQKAATEEYKKNKDLSVQMASKIYDLIENKKTRVAFDLFSNKQPLFERYLTPDAYGALESTVRRMSDPGWENGSEGIFYLSPVAERSSEAGVAPAKNQDGKAANREKAVIIITEIYTMLDHSQEAEAQGRFDKEKTFLKTYLDKEAFEMIKATVAEVGR